MILRLWRVLKPRLVAERMNAVYETLERPLVSVLARMERRGISIDRQVLSRLSGDFAQTAARVEAELQEIAGEPINVGSPKQIGDIIFGKMGIPAAPRPRPAHGRPRRRSSTNSPNRAMNFRRRFWNGGRCRN